MAMRSLTDNERQVLFGLVNRPGLNDRELSEALGIKVSTVTAIRRRLRKADYYTTRRIPMMNRIGWELLAASHGRLSQTGGPNASAKLEELLGDRFPTIFHFSDSPDHFFFLSMAKDYTAFRRDLEDLRLALHKAGLLDDGTITTTIFPVGMTAIGNFFDYSHVLALAFGIEHRTSFGAQAGKVADIELSRKETDVLVGLVRYPELSDKAVAAKIKASRQAVSKLRREFEATDLLRTVRIPNVRALGFELFASTFNRFTPTATIRARAEAIERTLRITPQYFYATCNSESVLLGAVKSYEHFSSLRQTLAKHYEERGFLAGDATIHLGLVGATNIHRSCDFGPMVAALKEFDPRPR